MAAPYRPKTTSLNHGLHFTGGEPFLQFELLCKAVAIARDHRIPSTFFETNCFWAVDDRITKEKLLLLKSKGLHGIMISVNPFSLDFIPFERTERAFRVALELFGRNVMVYQSEYFKRFRLWGLKDRITFKDYLRLERKSDFLRNVEFLIMARAPHALGKELMEVFPVYPADFFHDSCMPSFLGATHNHFDNYGNYIPGFCGGISLGDSRDLHALLNDGIDAGGYPVLNYLYQNDLKGLFAFANDYGYSSLPQGYFSKCHLCTHIGRYA